MKVALMALWAYIGDATDTKMEPHKVLRAEKLKIEGDFLTFEIDRHPGLDFYLCHTTQEWCVDLKTGRASHDEKWTPLTLEDLKSVKCCGSKVPRHCEVHKARSRR